LQTSSILNWVVAISLTTSWLPPFKDTTPITTTDLLQEVDFLTWRNMADLLQMVSFRHLVWANLTSYKFSLFFFLFLCTFSKFMMSLWIKFCKVASNYNNESCIIFKFTNELTNPFFKKRMLQIFRTSCLQKTIK
jgi:hypothetical protein